MSHLNPVIPELEKRKDYLEKLLLITEQQLENMPEGKLRIKNNRGIPRYYQITEVKDTIGTYIQKENVELAQNLAQKEYLTKVHKEIKAELQDINNYLKKHQLYNLEDIYDSHNEYRKKLIAPIIIPDDLYVKKWLEESYEINPYFPEQKVYRTKKGELVRSKSELLLADMYCELGIPYRYEAELLLKSGKKKYPDFTLLHPKTRKLIYHEHLGMMDDDKYRKDNLQKMDEYRRNGIYPGKNMIITFETEGCYLNIREIREMVKGLFFEL